MQPVRGSTALLALACLLVTAGSAAAQRRGDPWGEPPAKRYVHIPPDGDLQQILQAKLLGLGKESDVAGWLDTLKKHAKDIPWLAKSIDGLDPADPQLFNKLQKLQNFLGQAQPHLKIDPAQLKQMKGIQEALKQKFPDLPQPGDPEPKGINPAPRPEPDPPQGQEPRQPRAPAPPQQPREDPLSRWTEKLMDRLEGSRLGEKLNELPDWQRGLSDLRASLSGRKFELPGVDPERFRLPGDFNLTLPDLSGLKLPDLSLKGLRSPEINFSLPRLGGLGGGPSPPGGAGLGAAGQTVLWIALAVLVGAILWRVLVRGGWRGRRAAPTLEAGRTWPVDPGSVSTPADLIAAFEHLALLRLGEAARSSNHRDIADDLGRAGAPERRAADELASLYEQARYDPAGAALDGPQVEAARRHLSHLAGAGAA